jgi:gamma-glutamylcyclotransferase (GGCT)/AIG2-like uncharacterized protein YtfP
MKNYNHQNETCDRLFVYGTLQHGQSRNYILNGLKFEDAILVNHRKVVPPSLGFPFIINDKGSMVSGEIYYGTSPSLLSRIDKIEGEGELYHRILVKVKLSSGKYIEAFTYYPSEILIKNYT